MGQEPSTIFLLDGMRLKLSFQKLDCEHCGEESERVAVEPLSMYAGDLDGEWVALVPAANDSHLYLQNLERQCDIFRKALERVAEHPLPGVDRLVADDIRGIARQAIDNPCHGGDGLPNRAG